MDNIVHKSRRYKTHFPLQDFFYGILKNQPTKSNTKNPQPFEGQSLGEMREIKVRFKKKYFPVLFDKQLSIAESKLQNHFRSCQRKPIFQF